MDWYRRWIMVVCLLGACGGESGDDGVGEGTHASSGETSGSSTVTGSEASSAGEGSMSSSATTVGSTAEGSSSTGTTATGESTDPSGSDETEGAPCGGALCEPNEICINPCCGGAPPKCYPPDPNGACNGGDMIVDPSECVLGPTDCGTAGCCMTGPCQPPPPYCMDATGLECQGGDCSLDGCYGTLDGVDLFCLCA